MRRVIPDVLRTEPQFRLLFAGQVLSVVGDRVMLVALPFAVLESGGSTNAVGLVVAAQLAPFVFFAVVGGVVADRVDRRLLLITSDVARLAVQAAGGLLLVSGSATPAAIGALAFLYGTADAFFQPAFTGLLPQTVSHPGQLQPANALRGLSFSVASIGGPLLAGVLVGVNGAGAAMLFDAVTFAVSAVCLALLRPSVAETSAEEVPPGFVKAARDGWREVWSRPWLRSGLGAMSAYHAIVLPSVFVLGPVYIAERYGGPEAWAALVVAFGVGCIGGDVLLLRYRPRRALRLAGVGLLFAACQAAVYAVDARLVVLCVLQAVAAIGVTVFFTLWEVSLQEHIPSAALSRVASFDYLSSTALAPLGAALAGPVAVALGIRATLVGMSALGVLAAAVFLARPQVRSLERGTG
jgi:hypothetical protein